jgi:hypothetical protein
MYILIIRLSFPKNRVISDELKFIISGMTEKNPKKRIKLSELVELSKWFQIDD